MKTIFENVIARGDYDLAGLLKKIDGYHIAGRLSDAERDELYEKARTGANPAESVDVLAKIVELERRVKALEERQDSGTGSTDVPDEYEVGKWYYKDDKVMYDGKKYTCTAPDGVVCVWSPAEYPTYWAQS